MILSVVFGLLVTTAFVSASASQHREQDGVASFADPAVEYRAKFRYWLPDASVPVTSVQDDISNVSAIGGGGIELLPYYLYGLPIISKVFGLGGPPTDWAQYGFGTPAFNEIFRGALQATKDSGAIMDFAVGANQGQGVPSIPGTPGLEVQLLVGNATVMAGQSFRGPVPPPAKLSDNIINGFSFQGALEQFGTPNLTTVIAVEIMKTEITTSAAGNLSTSYVNETSIVDLTDAVNAGQLDWTAPTGAGNSTWRLLTFWEGYTNQRSCVGGVNATDFIGNGSWTVDHFSALGAQRTTDFLDEYVFPDAETQQLLRDVGNYAWEDSLEMLSVLWWTPGFLERFKAVKGYSLAKYLPLLYTASNQWGQLDTPYPQLYVYGNYTEDNDSVYNVDYRAVLNECYQEYTRHFVGWAHDRGLGYSNQPAYNLPLDMSADIITPDAPETESLGFYDILDAYRAFSGPAHLVGKKVISNEMGAVGASPYTLTVPALLFHVKRAWAGGSTQMVLHGYAYSGDYVNTTWPGYTAFSYAFTEMWNPLQPCWMYLKETMNYIARNNYILQQGESKVDIAFYLHAAPFTPRVHYYNSNLENLGYTYDFLGPSNFQLPEAVVGGSVLAPSGPAYKALVFSNQSAITKEAAQSVLSFAKAGLPIIFIGQLPNQTLSAVESKQIETLATMQEVLRASDKVHVLASADELPSLLADENILPRSQLQCSTNPVYTLWRSDTDVDYAYIYNDQSKAVNCSVAFTTRPRHVPFVLDAWSGKEEAMLTYVSKTPTTISTSLQLAANETMIVSFHKQGHRSSDSIASASDNVIHLSKGKRGKITAAIAGPAKIVTSTGKSISIAHDPLPKTNLDVWDLEIEDWHGPEDPAEKFTVRNEITMHHFTNQTLVPWTSLGDEFANVSGVGRYTTVFSVPQGRNSATLGAFLSLPAAQHTLRLTLNDRQLPAVNLVKPVVDISPFLVKNGQNVLMVEITTTLSNRIKASAATSLLIGKPVAELRDWRAPPTQDYGLFGPVVVNWVDWVNVDV